MRQFFGSFSLDRLSFWLGFLAGLLAWWLVGVLRPGFKRLLAELHRQSQNARTGLTATTEIRLKNDILQYVQRQHLASPLFSLDEIYIQVNLLSPPAQVEPGLPPAAVDIADSVIPYMPDWPEMAAAYGAPQLTLQSALQGGRHIALLGRPGSGKTTCLSHLAAEICQNEKAAPNGQPILPLPVHFHDLGVTSHLDLPLTPDIGPLQNIVAAVSNYTSPLTQPRLANFLQTVFKEGRVLLLLDGLDEVPPADARLGADFLATLLKTYPDIQVVAAAAPESFTGLPALGFTPLALAGWSEKQRVALILRWRENWNRFVEPASLSGQNIDPHILDSWLFNDSQSTSLTPLELTLKIWSVYAGDNLGPAGSQAIDAYLRRMCVDIPRAMPVLRELALKILTQRKPTFTQKEAQEWIYKYEINPVVAAAEGVAPRVLADVQPITMPAVTSRRVLPALVENGLLMAHRDGRQSFSHIGIASHLAAAAMLEQGIPENIAAKEAGAAKVAGANDMLWVYCEQSLEYLAASADLSSVVEHWLQSDSQPLHQRLVSAARWLRISKEDVPWRRRLLRRLADLAQNENQPLGLRARIITALSVGGGSGTDAFFRQMLVSPKPASRQLAALAFGMMRDGKAVDDISQLLADPLPGVYKAACLALVAIGSRPALEAVADTLLQSSDEQRQSAAQALANNAEDGIPTLQEGATLDDLLVRKAVISGLKRVRQPWAYAQIEKMRVEDSQWVVKNAATQALEELAIPTAQPPKNLPELTETPWLIAFAGEKGIGVAPGKAAHDLLLLALKEGKEEQRLAALDILRQKGDSSGVLPVYHLLYSTQGDVHEAAFNTLWHLNAAGVELPPPEQFGLGFPH